MLRGLGFFFCLAISAELASSDASAAPEICQYREDKGDASSLDAFLVASLKEHELYPFSRPLKAQARAGARNFLDQRIGDKLAEACAEHLKVAEEIKALPPRFHAADCAGAATVVLLDGYVKRVKGIYEENRRIMDGMHDQHLHGLKLRLFELARGSIAGMDRVAVSGVPFASLSKDRKFEWIKQEASKLGAEAHLVWGRVGADSNPLVQKNLLFAQEATRAKQELSSARARYRTDGKLGAHCKAK